MRINYTSPRPSHPVLPKQKTLGHIQTRSEKFSIFPLHACTQVFPLSRGSGGGQGGGAGRGGAGWGWCSMDVVISAKRCCLSISPPGFPSPPAGMQPMMALLCVLRGQVQPPGTQPHTQKAAVTQPTRGGEVRFPSSTTEVSLSSGFAAL